MIYDGKKKVEVFFALYIVSFVAAKKPIPFRLDDALIERLDSASRRIGQPRAGLVRYLVDTWLSHFESEGTAMLPPDWKQIMRDQDGRTGVPGNSPDKIQARPETIASYRAEEKARKKRKAP